MGLEPLAVLEFHKGRGKERKRGGKGTFPKDTEANHERVHHQLICEDGETHRMKRLRRHDD